MAKSWLQKYATYEEEVVASAVGITAFATGGQGSATQLLKKFNQIDTVVTANDSVKLVPALIGKVQGVFNNGANDLTVYPATGEYIDATINNGYVIASGDYVEFRAYASGRWDSYAGAASGTGTVTSVSVVTANGFGGTVATSTTTPAITIRTTITGILVGNGTSISAAVAGDFPTLNQNTTGTASNVTGIVAVANGGTGLNALGSALQVIRVNAGGTALEYATIASGSGAITIGTTTITSGTNSYLLYQESNVVSQTSSMAYVAGTGLSLTSTGTTSATYSQKNFNSGGGELFHLRSSGQIEAGLLAGGNLFMGMNAGLAITSGLQNTALGYHALFANTSGQDNTAVGYNALAANTTSLGSTAVGYSALMTSTGAENTAFGWKALRLNTAGTTNTALGVKCLENNTIGINNTAIGTDALLANVDGNYNTAVGMDALITNITGDYNTAVGYQALYNNLADENSAFGRRALYTNTTGSGNVAVGLNTLNSNATGNHNTAVGANSLLGNTATSNTAIGYSAATTNSSGVENTAIGKESLNNNSTGSDNTAIGYRALYASTGNNNTALGTESGRLCTGSGNLFLGRYAGFWQTAVSNIGIIDNQLRTDEPTELTNAPIVIGFNSTVASQTIRLSGVVTASVSLTSPIALHTTSTTSPIISGGSATTASLTLKPTSGVGDTGANIIFGIGNNGATTAMRIFNAGGVVIGSASAVNGVNFDVRGAVSFFGSNIGDVYFNNADIEYNYSTNAAATGLINNGGYLLGGTQFRSLDIRNGKFASIAFFDGTTSNVGFGVSSPTAVLHLKAGTATANSGPFQINVGVSETTARSGLIQFSSSSSSGIQAISGSRFTLTESDTTERYIVQAASSVKTTAGAPYANDGYVNMVVNGTTVRVMTTT